MCADQDGNMQSSRPLDITDSSRGESYAVLPFGLLYLIYIQMCLVKVRLDIENSIICSRQVRFNN